MWPCLFTLPEPIVALYILGDVFSNQSYKMLNVLHQSLLQIYPNYGEMFNAIHTAPELCFLLQDQKQFTIFDDDLCPSVIIHWVRQDLSSGSHSDRTIKQLEENLIMLCVIMRPEHERKSERDIKAENEVSQDDTSEGVVVNNNKRFVFSCFTSSVSVRHLVEVMRTICQVS